MECEKEELSTSKQRNSCNTEYKCNFPKELCEKLRGKDGQNKKLIEESTGVKIFLKDNPHLQEFKLCLIKGKLKYLLFVSQIKKCAF